MGLKKRKSTDFLLSLLYRVGIECAIKFIWDVEKESITKDFINQGLGINQRLGMTQHIIDMDPSMDWCIGSYLCSDYRVHVNTARRVGRQTTWIRS